MNSLIESMTSLNDAINKITAIIPNDVKSKMSGEMNDLNRILAGLKSEDMEILTEIKDKYANKNNK